MSTVTAARRAVQGNCALRQGAKLRRPNGDKARPNGVVLWEGKGPTSNAPLVVIATGFARPSSNPKTGPMVQVAVLRRDIEPTEAVASGQDDAVCNGCELRPFTVRQKVEELGLMPGDKPSMCYVTSSHSLLGMYRAYKAGAYPKVGRRAIEFVFSGKVTRMGMYGNFSNVPLWVVEDVAAASEGWTLYEHNWRAEHAQGLRPYAMASVSSVGAKEDANALGWRTFRVKQPHEPVLPDEVFCPAAEEAGKKTTCFKCQLCNGTALGAKNVVINDHGPTSQAHKQQLIQLGGIGRTTA